MMAKHGLGRGFESLIPTELVDDEFDPTVDEEKEAGQKLIEVKIEEIVRDEEQPRKDFDPEALEALAESIKQHGILSPIVVMKKEGKYQIVAGERRYRAAKIAELKKVPVIVRTLDAQNKLELSIIENAQREDLNAIELATAYAKLKTQFNLSNEEIAKRVGKAKITVENTLRLLNLPDEAKKAMREHKLSEGVMRPLVSADEKTVKAALPKIIEEGWTVRQVEQFVAGKKKPSSAKAMKLNSYKKQEAKLTEKYTAKVRISATKVTFSCKNEKELKELLSKLG
ncbi:ParB/RepB/Spo0J family partition protein [Candidatus Saccharibacteria bacterium]|nr:ParB/RepB/Spo0J family partition protein [Candidatus Saccharibacteria bacterium]